MNGESPHRLLIYGPESSADFLSKKLGAAGCDVYAFTDPNAALVEAQQQAYDLAVIFAETSDPRILDLVYRLRAGSTKVLQITTNGSRSRVVDEILEFPCLAADLVAKVNQMVEKRQ